MAPPSQNDRTESARQRRSDSARVRSVFVTDTTFANAERALLTRLELGLADEGVDVRTVLPSDTSEPEVYDLLSQPVMYRQHTFRPFAALSAQRTFERLAPDWGADDARIVHAFGGGAWRFAIELASRLNAVAVLEVWRPGVVNVARRYDTVSAPVVFSAPGVSIERGLLAQKLKSPVRCVPWGGACASVARAVLPPGERPSMVLMGRGRDANAYRAAFEGAITWDGTPPPHVFVDGEGARRTNLWKLAGVHNALDRVTLVDRLEDRRELLLGADLLLYPDARGEHRSALLDMMGSGIPVIGSPDPTVSVLACNERVVCVDDPTAMTSWARAVSELLVAPSRAREVGASGRQLISERYRWHHHVEAVVGLYRQIASGVGRERQAAPAESGNGAA